MITSAQERAPQKLQRGEKVEIERPGSREKLL